MSKEIKNLEKKVESLQGEVLALKAVLTALTQNALSNSPDYTNVGQLREAMKDRKALSRFYKDELSDSLKTEFAYHLGEILEGLDPYIDAD